MKLQKLLSCRVRTHMAIIHPQHLSTKIKKKLLTHASRKMTNFLISNSAKHQSGPQLRPVIKPTCPLTKLAMKSNLNLCSQASKKRDSFLWPRILRATHLGKLPFSVKVVREKIEVSFFQPSKILTIFIMAIRTIKDGRLCSRSNNNHSL